MAEKDIVERSLEGFNDVFSDILAVLLFNGKVVVPEDELEDASPYSYYKVEGERGQERDVSKYWKKKRIRIAFFGAENQTKSEKNIPLRIIGYDGAAYRNELAVNAANRRKGLDEIPLYPVVTLVLYFGYEQHWNYPTHLVDCFDVPDELKPFVSDYKVNLFEIAFLSDEQVAMFRSDFKILADYCVQMRKNGDYKPSPEKLTHVRELLHLMSVMTRDNRFEDAYYEFEKEGKEPENMCEVLDRIEARGEVRGEVRGKTIGINAERKETLTFVQNLRDAGQNDTDVLNALLKRLGESVPTEDSKK